MKFQKYAIKNTFLPSFSLSQICSLQPFLTIVLPFFSSLLTTELLSSSFSTRFEQSYFIKIGCFWLNLKNTPRKWSRFLASQKNGWSKMEEAVGRFFGSASIICLIRDSMTVASGKVSIRFSRVKIQSWIVKNCGISIIICINLTLNR